MMTVTTSRLDRLYEIGERRKSEPPPLGSRRIGDYHDGAYESPFVSPYSKTAGNPGAEIFIVLQDWASHDFLSRAGAVDDELSTLGLKPSLPTNRNLSALLNETFSLLLPDVFATNAFPFVKPGKMSTRVGSLTTFTEQFVFPQIEVVKPKLVIFLGARTFRAASTVLGRPVHNCIGDAIGNPIEIDGRTYFCQAHTGARGTVQRNGQDGNAVRNDWGEMALKLRWQHIAESH